MLAVAEPVLIYLISWINALHTVELYIIITTIIHGAFALKCVYLEIFQLTWPMLVSVYRSVNQARNASENPQKGGMHRFLKEPALPQSSYP
jgi:hypothetical protein